MHLTFFTVKVLALWITGSVCVFFMLGILALKARLPAKLIAAAKQKIVGENPVPGSAPKMRSARGDKLALPMSRGTNPSRRSPVASCDEFVFMVSQMA